MTCWSIVVLLTASWFIGGIRNFETIVGDAYWAR